MKKLLTSLLLVAALGSQAGICRAGSGDAAAGLGFGLIGGTMMGAAMSNANKDCSSCRRLVDEVRYLESKNRDLKDEIEKLERRIKDLEG